METVEQIIDKIKKETDVFSKARLIGYLLKERDVKVIDLSKKLGINSSYVCHLNRLNKLPDIIIDAYYSKLISVSHLFLLSRISDFKKMVSIYEEILAKNLSIQDTENVMREYLYGVKNRGNYMKDKEKLQKKLEDKYADTRATVTQTRVYGKLTLQFKGNLEKTTRLIREAVSKLSD